MPEYSDEQLIGANNLVKQWREEGRVLAFKDAQRFNAILRNKGLLEKRMGESVQGWHPTAWGERLGIQVENTKTDESSKGIEKPLYPQSLWETLYKICDSQDMNKYKKVAVFAQKNGVSEDDLIRNCKALRIADTKDAFISDDECRWAMEGSDPEYALRFSDFGDTVFEDCGNGNSRTGKRVHVVVRDDRVYFKHLDIFFHVDVAPRKVAVHDGEVLDLDNDYILRPIESVQHASSLAAPRDCADEEARCDERPVGPRGFNTLPSREPVGAGQPGADFDALAMYRDYLESRRDAFSEAWGRDRNKDDVLRHMQNISFKDYDGLPGSYSKELFCNYYLMKYGWVYCFEYAQMLTITRRHLGEQKTVKLTSIGCGAEIDLLALLYAMSGVRACYEGIDSVDWPNRVSKFLPANAPVEKSFWQMDAATYFREKRGEPASCDAHVFLFPRILSELDPGQIDDLSAAIQDYAFDRNERVILAISHTDKERLDEPDAINDLNNPCCKAAKVCNSFALGLKKACGFQGRIRAVPLHETKGKIERRLLQVADQTDYGYICFKGARYPRDVDARFSKEIIDDFTQSVHDYKATCNHHKDHKGFIKNDEMAEVYWDCECDKKYCPLQSPRSTIDKCAFQLFFFE